MKEIVRRSPQALTKQMAPYGVVGTLFSIDPAMSVIIAAPILRQTITAVAVLGVIVVSLAGTLLVWASGGDDANGKVGQ